MIITNRVKEAKLKNLDYESVLVLELQLMNRLEMLSLL